MQDFFSTMKQIKQSLHRKFDRFFFDENWQTIIIKSSPLEFLQFPSLKNKIYHKKSIGFCFYADPFILIKNSKIYLFFERYSYFLKCGFIDFIIINTDTFSILRHEKNIIKSNKHLSFPYILEDEGKIVIIPECQEKELKMYEINDKIEVISNKYIYKTGFVDSVVIKKDGIYYLFTTKVKKYNDCDLHIFYSKNLNESEWTEHPKSPVNTGFYGSRMAGNLFHENGKIFRPGQISKNTYGDGICVYEVEKLSINEYKEALKYEIFGESIGFDGIHTFSSNGKYIAIDVKKHRYSVIKFAIKILRLTKIHFLFLIFRIKT